MLLPLLPYINHPHIWFIFLVEIKLFPHHTARSSLSLVFSSKHQEMRLYISSLNEQVAQSVFTKKNLQLWPFVLLFLRGVFCIDMKVFLFILVCLWWGKMRFYCKYPLYSADKTNSVEQCIQGMKVLIRHVKLKGI